MSVKLFSIYHGAITVNGFGVSCTEKAPPKNAKVKKMTIQQLQFEGQIQKIVQKDGFAYEKEAVALIPAEKRIEGAGNFSNQGSKCLMGAIRPDLIGEPARLGFTFGI